MKNLQVLVREMQYKVQNNCSPEIMNKLFPINEPIYEYDLRNTSDFIARRIKTGRYGSESLSYLGPRLWNILPDEYKKIQSVKDKIRSWVTKNCPCRLCKIYIQRVGDSFVFALLLNLCNLLTYHEQSRYYQFNVT